VFFRKIRSCVSFTKRDFKYSKFDANSNSLNPLIRVVVCSSIPSLRMSCLLDKPHIRPVGSVDVGRMPLNHGIYCVGARYIPYFPFDPIGEFARILALSRARSSTPALYPGKHCNVLHAWVQLQSISSSS